MCFWRKKPKRVKLRYKLESIHLDEQIDSYQVWITNYRMYPVSYAYQFILKNITLGNDLSVNIVSVSDEEQMVIEFEGYKQDIKEYINTLIAKDINFIRWYKITLD